MTAKIDAFEAGLSAAYIKPSESATHEAAVGNSHITVSSQQLAHANVSTLPQTCAQQLVPLNPFRCPSVFARVA